jgi:hypothetical protein
MSQFWSLRATCRAVAAGWNEFFHRPGDGRVCAAIRLVYAALVLIHLAVLYPDLERWFTSVGVLPYELSRDTVSSYSWTLLGWLPDTSAAVHTAFWVATGHAVCLLMGLLPRFNAFFLFLWIVSFEVRNEVIMDGEDRLMRMLGFLMIWLPSGQCWSVHSLLRRWRKKSTAPDDCLVAGWPLRLIQIEMAAMFLSSGLLKLSGQAWLDGTAMYYVSRLDDFFGRLPVPAWMFDTPWVVALITWSVLAAELFIPLLIWFRETRLPCLTIVLAFHLANEWTMNLFLFHWLMLCGWMAFLRPEDLIRLSNVFSRDNPTKAVASNPQ